MRILVESGSYNLLNLGDMAMLQVALTRIHSRFPEAEIYVFTTAPTTLVEWIPYAIPYSPEDRDRWCNQTFLPSLSARFSRICQLTGSRLNSRFYLKYPSVWTSISDRLLSTFTRYGNAQSDFATFLSTIDLFVVAGAGGINDLFEQHARMVLLTLRHAKLEGIPIALLGQGLGPVKSRSLHHTMSATMPYVDLLTLRESYRSVPLAIGAGLPMSRLIVTSDDALELASAERNSYLGHAVGVNLRCASYALMDKTRADEIGTAVAAEINSLKAPAVVVPIRIPDDITSAEYITRHCVSRVRIGADIRFPVDLLTSIRLCRIVVTGSYHAAVFALAQGVPSVGVAANEYYLTKFQGLREQYGDGCAVIDVSDASWKSKLKDAIRVAHDEAETLRARILPAIDRDVRVSSSAYDRLCDIVNN